MLGQIDILHRTQSFWRARQLWSAIVCCFLDHKVPLSAPNARFAESYWLVTCERCGKPTRV
jgi:hypothetical protein